MELRNDSQATGCLKGAPGRLIVWAIILLTAIPIAGFEAWGDCLPSPSGLAAWWAGDGNAVDFAGGNHGTLHGAASYVTGKVDQAFSFDGASGYVQIPRSPSLDIGGQVTVEFWMKADPSNSMSSCCQGLVTTDFYGIDIGGGGPEAIGVQLYISTTSGAGWATTGDANGGGAALSRGVWHHVAGTYDGSQLQLYVDGQSWGNPMTMPDPGPISPMLPNSFVAIGSEAGRTTCPDCTYSRFFKGAIDEVGIYNRVLSAGEIADIYNAGAAGRCKNIPPFFLSIPMHQSALVGGSVNFSATAAGPPPLNYQWQFNGVNLDGANSNSLTLRDLQLEQAGIYTLWVTNSAGATNVDVALTVNPRPPCTVAPSGLVSWWRGEGDGLDQMSVNNGSLQSGATSVTGFAGRAFSFNGSGAYVKIPRSPGLDVTNQFTIDFWMNSDPNNSPSGCCQGLVTSDFYEIMINGSSAQGVGINLAVSTNAGISSVSISDANGGVPIISPGGWHHIAGTYDGAQLQLYVDGVAWGYPMPVTEPISPMRANSFVAIGSESGRTSCPSCVNNRFFKGLIDEVDIFNRALSADEIAMIYNANAVGKCTNLPPIFLMVPTNLTVWEGTSAAFYAAAAGAPSLGYQWQFNGTNISGATSSSLILANAQIVQGGTYTLTVTNSFGSTNVNVVLTINSAPPCVPAPSGLAGWWRGEGNAWDQLGANNGSFQGGATNAGGFVGRAFSFNGNNAYVKIPNGQSLGISNQFTIDFWMNADPSNPMTSCCQGLVTSDFYEVLVGGGGPQRVGIDMSVSTTAGDSWASTGDANGGGTVISSGVWHHIAGTYDGTQLQLYVDGVPSGNPMPLTGAVSPMKTNSFIAIGSESGRTSCPSCVNSRFFKGLIDEVDIFNRALSAGEIAMLYNAAVSGKCIITNPVSIITQPVNSVVNPGTNLTLQVGIIGTMPVNYQWFLNGTPIVGATNSSFALTNVQPNNSGSYFVTVSNALNAVTSSNAVLRVNMVLAYANGLLLSNAQNSYNGPVTVKLQNLYTNGLVFYTLDGSVPTFSSTQYAGPFIVSHSAVLRTLAYSVDFLQSAVSDPVSLLILPSFTLTASTGGGGTVGLSPVGGTYISNTTVTATATPLAGWSFLQWLGDATGTNSVIPVTISRNKSIKAIFGTTVASTASAGGAVAPTNGVYPYGTVVPFSAIPQSGNYFAIWGNAASGNANPLYFLVTNANPTVSALFQPLGGGQAALTVIPSGHGKVTVSPSANLYSTGASVTLTAVPDPAQSFIGWSGDASGTSNPLGITMNASKVITANFTRKSLLTVTPPQGGVTDQGFQFTLDGDFGGVYRIDSSTSVVSWLPMMTVTNAYGRLQFLDPQGTNSSRMFYRAVQLQ